MAAFLSEDWYRVAPLRLRLRSHVEIHRQTFRGDIWYVVQDLHSGRYHRISPAANLVMSLMDGRRTMQALWEVACERFPEDPPTQSDMIHLVSQLHASDLVAGDTLPDIRELGRRHFKQERRAMIARLKNPLALRFPLFDPDPFLEATIGLVRPLFTIWGMLAWLALVITGVVLAVLHIGALGDDIADRVLSRENLLLIAIAYPMVKAIHEMGHAYATKVWGGEVHEIGLMFLVLIPVPYVDGSASAAFPEKWRRAVVGGAGIMVELALAAAAMIFWVNAEPGLARAFAFNVMLIGGVSTLLFNGNPLLRFDGYFVLSDVLEMPNLATRANKYFWYLVQRYVLGMKEARSPITAKGERGWFLFYSIAAFIYRIFISIAISLFIASKLFFIGIILAVWALSNVFLFPILKGLRFLLTDKGLRRNRRRALGLSAAAVAVLAYGLFWMPVPYATLADGVVVFEEEQIVRAETGGFVDFVTEDASDVAAGDVLVRLADPALESEARLAEARLAEIRMRLGAATLSDQVQVSIYREQEAFLSERLTHIRNLEALREVRAAQPGEIVLPEAKRMLGKLVEKGAVLGYLRTDAPVRLRVAVSETSAELVRGRTDETDVRFQSDLGTVVPAKIVAAPPEGTAILPSPGLATDAGGAFARDPTDPDGFRTIETLFVFDLVPETDVHAFLGERAIVRFDHGSEPVGYRIIRNLRQVFLRQFNV